MGNGSSFSTGLAKVVNTFLPMIERQLTGNGVQMDQYARQCVINTVSAINNLLEINGIAWNNPNLDRNNITQILLNVASLKLNAAASPREVFYQLRNVKMKDHEGKEIWKKQIEMGIEGDGNDAILARFGRDVEKIGQFWLVRENDEFEYPVYNGFEVQPPKWKPTGKGKVVRVVYPIKKKDGTVEYHIAEREDVLKNLIAHINNNLMNETFGICEDRYKANAAQKKQIAAKKAEVLNRLKNLDLETILDDPEVQKWISPAWRDPHSRESMIIRKMRNNIVKKIPKDFGNAYVALAYQEVADEDYREVKREIEENANSEVIDVEYNVSSPDEAPEEQQPENFNENQNPDENLENHGDNKETEQEHKVKIPNKKQKPEKKAVASGVASEAGQQSLGGPGF